MKNKYLTRLGVEGRGQGVNRTPTSAVQYTHDIFLRAASERLDVYMLCGLLCEELRDTLYKVTTGRYFADSVRDVLQAGRNVSIFVWDNINIATQSPTFVRLMAEARACPEWGALNVRSSGTRQGEESINHFIIAKSPDGSRWILRVEKPHARPTPEQLSSAKFEVPAALIFDTAAAKMDGEPLLAVFEQLFRTVGNATAVRNASPSAQRLHAIH